MRTETIVILNKITARTMRPTNKHKIAIWNGILGTVYARNAAGETQYFDYDFESAIAFAEITDDSDPRYYRYDGRSSSWDPDRPRTGQRVLWVRR